MQRELDSAIKYQKSFAGSNTFRVSFISAPWEFFHDFCRLLIFFLNHFFFRKILSGIPSEWQTVKLDPDQTRPFLGPGLGPNCLQRLTADAYRRQGVKILSTIEHTLEMVYGTLLNFFKMFRVIRVSVVFIALNVWGK